VLGHKWPTKLIGCKKLRRWKIFNELNRFLAGLGKGEVVTPFWRRRSIMISKGSSMLTLAKKRPTELEVRN
jgi:chorismate-pyruvate lyase